MHILVYALNTFGVATISRLLKIIGLLCRISSLLKGSFAKETYNFKEPTNRSHPIPCSLSTHESTRTTANLCVLYTYTPTQFAKSSDNGSCYGVASIGRLLKMIGLFCRIQSV